MSELNLSDVLARIEQAGALYHRLILLVAPPGAGKTEALRHVAQQVGAPLINVNLEISRLLLDLTERQRALQLPRLLGDLLETTKAEVILLDNTEILFAPSLRQDPLRLLQGLSRNRTVVATWNGSVKGGRLVYAETGHPEHQSYPVQDLLVVSPGMKS